jgi:hypothetical protein
MPSASAVYGRRRSTAADDTVAGVGVLAIWRHPVKGMLGERVAAVLVGPDGPHGDRAYAVFDVRTGERIATKRGATDARLRACRAALDADDRLVVTLPDGTTATGEADAAEAVGALLGRPVRLERGRHRDFAPVHLLTTATLAHLRALAPASDWAPERFRANLLLDDGAAPGAFTEDALLGRPLTGPSGLELTVTLPTPRCVAITRDDPAVLRTIARHHRVALPPLNRPACAGAYADVARAGVLAAGERLAAG